MYALTFLSGGLFPFVWLVLLMRDINELEGKRIFRTGPIAALYTVALAVHLLLTFGFSQTWATPPGTPTYKLVLATGVAFGLLAMLIGSVVVVARRIAFASGRKFGFVGALTTFILTVPFFVSFPILQSRLNRLRDSPAKSP